MNSRKRRQLNLSAAKERRQKQIVAVGGILLLILIAIQVPRMMKSGGGSQTPATAPTSSTATSPDPAALVATPATHTTLPNSDVAPARTKSQLLSFERFDSKDPFVQQVSDQPPAVSATPAATGSTASAVQTATATVSPTVSSGPSVQASRSSGASTRGLTAAIEVNGERESVAVAQTFPKSNPTFKLVSLANDVAMIGIAGGAYASGAQTVSLQTGKALTLVDTADGKRYELRLMSIS